jgi:hypothetical protein
MRQLEDVHLDARQHRTEIVEILFKNIEYSNRIVNKNNKDEDNENSGQSVAPTHHVEVSFPFQFDQRLIELFNDFKEIFDIFLSQKVEDKKQNCCKTFKQKSQLPNPIQEHRIDTSDVTRTNKILKRSPQASDSNDD